MWRKLALAISLLLGGCSFSETIADHSIGYNQTVAESADAQILLNILRSRDRQPTHFSALTEFKGSLKQTTSGGISFTLPFGGAADPNFTASPQFNLSQETQPTYTVAVLDTVKEFAHAVMKPITLDDLKLFMDQGWSLELLLYMIVESGQIHDITVEDGDNTEAPLKPFEELLGLVCTDVGRKVKNATIHPQAQRDASAGQHAQCFNAIVNYLARGDLPPDVDKKFALCPEVRTNKPRGARLHIVRDFSGELVSPELPKTDLNDVKKVAEVSKMGFSFVEVGNTYRLCETAVSSRFCIAGVQDCAVSSTRAEACEAAMAVAYGKSNAAALQAPLAVHRADGSGIESMILEVPLSCPQSGERPRTRFTFSAQLRSLQGMIYYAGELIRNQQFRSSAGDPSHSVPQHCLSSLAPESLSLSGVSAYRPLIQVETGAPPSDAAISVVYQGKPYWIRSGEECSDSLSVVALLIQIQALYQSRAEIPASQTILSID